MKKMFRFILVIIAMSFVFNNVNALEVSGSQEKQETYYLGDLLNDKEEQDKILKEAEENVVIDYSRQAISPFIMDIVGTSSDTSITEPSDSSLLRNVDGGQYLWYVTQMGVVKSNTSMIIYRHNISSNTNEAVFTSDKGVYAVTYYLNDNILYVLYVKNYNISAAWGTEYDTSYVVGINIDTGSVVYEQSFDVPQDCTYLPSFAVDADQRFYFVYRSTGTRVFDKNGNLIYDHEPIENSTYKILIKGVSPNGKALFFEAMYQTSSYAYFQSVYEGIQKLNNGVFVQSDYTVYGRGELGLFTVYSYNPRWYFLDTAGTYASDQYGRIVKFDYNADNTIGVDKTILLTMSTGVYDYKFYEPQYPHVCKNGNYIYLMGSNGNIYRISQSGDTFTPVDYIDAGFDEYYSTTGVGYQDIYAMTCNGNNLVVTYYKNGNRYAKTITLDSSSFTEFKDRVITNHSTTSHTQAQIKAQAKAAVPAYDYNKSVYKTTPSWTSPYSEGSLQDQVITDTLNMLNYNRWLVGVPSITVNTSKMARSQKCAVISKANGTISHTPAQPSGMSDSFYSEAYDGCYAKYETGDIYSGNVGYGDKTPYEAIRGYVSDLDNISIGSRTGHRQSMLDPKATQVSFGYVETYSAVSIYYDPDKELEEEYYAFPSAGYFPSEEMKLGEYWSIYMSESGLQGTAYVKFTYNGKTYQGTGLLFESGYPVLSFMMPDELINLLGSENSNVPAGTSIGVEVYGLKDADYNNITYKYTVNFFNAESERPVTSISLDKTSVTLEKGKSTKVNITINPSNTTDDTSVSVSITGAQYVTADRYGNITAVSPGTATVTYHIAGKTATVKVTVTDPNKPITGVKINESSLIVAIGKTKKLTATITPSNTTQSKTLTWSSSNTKVATVDANGNVKGIKAGTATITVKTSNGKTASLKVTVKKATPIKSVKLNKSSAKLAIGKTLQLKATINPTATTDDTTLTWSSSNKKVATVDSNGKVTAVAAGTAKITVKTSNGKKKTIKVTVSKISAKKAKIAAIENQVQTGKAIKPTVTVTLNGTTLKSGTDYTVTYKNNKKAGKATVTVKFKGNYTGTVKTTFLIIPKKVSIKTPTTTKKTITVKYTKVSGATTYQIAYRVKGTTEWKYTTSTAASKKISKLTSGKEYEVMVRAGIKSGSKKLYGEWSDIKTITVK